MRSNDAEPIDDYIRSRDRVPLIDPNKHEGAEQRSFDPAEKSRYKIRTTVERANAHLAKMKQSITFRSSITSLANRIRLEAQPTLSPACGDSLAGISYTLRIFSIAFPLASSSIILSRYRTF